MIIDLVSGRVRQRMTHEQRLKNDVIIVVVD